MSKELIESDEGAAPAGYTPAALSRAPLSAAAPAPLAARARARALVENCTREPGCADHADSLHVLPSGTQPPQIVGRRRRFTRNERRR